MSEQMKKETCVAALDGAPSRDDVLEEAAREAEHWQQISKPEHKCGEYIAAAIRGMKSSAGAAVQPVAPIDMILHCPKCGLQHVDKSEVENVPVRLQGIAWTNPPHRSHLCHGCGHIWRPADVPTNGVAAIKTKGKADSAAPASKPKEPQPLQFRPVQEGVYDVNGVQYEIRKAADTADIGEAGRAAPMQPLHIDEHGTIRFRANKIVDFLASNRLNELATMDFPREDWEQLAQLIGYSLSGFSELSYVSDEAYGQAAEQAKLLTVGVQACRPEDRAMLQTDAGKELLAAASKAMAADKAPTDIEMMDAIIHEITGDEGEDDCFTYMRRALSELMEYRRKDTGIVQELPPLPEPEVASVLIHLDDGEDTFEDCYTTNQVREAQREAYELGKRAALSQKPAQAGDERALTDDDVERLSLQAGWEGNRKYMTPADFHIWCERMRKFAALSRQAVPTGQKPVMWVPRHKKTGWINKAMIAEEEADQVALDRGYEYVELYAAPVAAPAVPAGLTDTAMLDWLERHFTDMHGVYPDADGAIRSFAVDCEDDTFSDEGRVRSAIGLAMLAAAPAAPVEGR